MSHLHIAKGVRLMLGPGASITTLHLELLPDLAALRRICQSIAMLDAILSREWSSRYYSFNSMWAPGKEMASMRNGSGDDYYLLFTEAGAVLKGYAHETAMASHAARHGQPWPGVLDNVPPEFADFLAEPAFSLNDTTFCVWRRRTDAAWNIGSIDFPNAPDPDGSADLLIMLDGNPLTYKTWAEEYCEPGYEDEDDDQAVELDPHELPLAAITEVYAHTPLTEELVSELNPAVSLADLADDIKEIGYPSPITQ